MQLYHNPLSQNSRRATIVAEHLDLDVKLELVDLMKGGNRTPEFTKLNPNGKVPVLVDGDFVLTESRVIMQYLASKKPESGLLPSDERGRYDVLRWLTWDAAHFSPPQSTVVFERMLKPMMGMGEPSQTAIDEATNNFTRFAKVLDGHLQGNEYVVGTQLSVADLSLACAMTYLVPSGLSIDGLSNLQAWFGRIRELEAWKKTEPQFG